MEQQCREIIASLYTDRKINEFFSKLHPSHLQDELKEYSFAAVCELAHNNPDRLKMINEKPGALFGFVVKIARRQLMGSNSKFRKVFRDTDTVDIDERPDIDMLHQEAVIDHSRELREEIINRWLTGDAVYANDLASVQKVYATGRGIRAELKYMEELQRGLFSDGYVLFNVPVLVRVEDPNSDKVADAGEFLGNYLQKLVGRELGRENDSFIVRIGEAVVIEAKI